MSQPVDEAIALQVIELDAAGMGASAIARELNITRAAAYAIARGTSWKHHLPRPGKSGEVVAEPAEPATAVAERSDAYAYFVANKLSVSVPTGIERPDESSRALAHLFSFQRDLVIWALRLGRAAIFAGTGLGKTRMQLAWAWCVHVYTGKPMLIFAPLAVAVQTVSEGEAVGIPVTLCRSSEDMSPGLNITNYERLHLFDTSGCGGVVWDESSIFKDYNSKTLAQHLEAFAHVAFRLACTATPSPNDYVELGTHAELLGICKRVEMLAEYFVHDGGSTQDWRLKGHARQAFWRFVSSWAALVRKPSDLGHSDDGYNLPPLKVEQHIIESSPESALESGSLVPQRARTLSEQRAARKASLDDRVARCIELVNADGERWVVWADLNPESEALAAGINGAIEVTGSQDIEEKEARLMAFIRGESRVLVTKPAIGAWGLNLQFCARTAFVGVSHSWERYYQAVRRFYRFGQTRPVHVHLFCSELEGDVLKNLQRKERDAEVMAEELSRETREMVREAVSGSKRRANTYNPSMAIRIPEWLRSA